MGGDEHVPAAKEVRPLGNRQEDTDASAGITDNATFRNTYSRAHWQVPLSCWQSSVSMVHHMFLPVPWSCGVKYVSPALLKRQVAPWNAVTTCRLKKHRPTLCANLCMQCLLLGPQWPPGLRRGEFAKTACLKLSE